MAYFLEVIEKGSIFLSAAGLVSSIIIFSFFESELLTENQAASSELSFLEQVFCNIPGVSDRTETK